MADQTTENPQTLIDELARTVCHLRQALCLAAELLKRADAGPFTCFSDVDEIVRELTIQAEGVDPDRMVPNHDRTLKTYGMDSLVGNETRVRVVCGRHAFYVLRKENGSWTHVLLSRPIRHLRDAVAAIRDADARMEDSGRTQIAEARRRGAVALGCLDLTVTALDPDPEVHLARIRGARTLLAQAADRCGRYLEQVTIPQAPQNVS